MKRIHRLIFVLAILILCTGCDQVVKTIAKRSLATSAPISLLNGLIVLEYHENTGAFLSLGANLPVEVRFVFFTVIVCLILGATLVFTLKASNLSRVQLVGLSLLAAGGVGNLIDRIFNNGAAIDYIHIGVGSLRTGIFNMADLAIVAGIVIILLSSFQIPHLSIGKSKKNGQG